MNLGLTAKVHFSELRDFTFATTNPRYQLGKQFDVDRQDVRGYIIGEHGDSELIVWSSVTIGAIPLTAFLTPEITLESLKQGYTEATRKRGYDILQRKGHTSYGVATVVTQIVDARTTSIKSYR